MELEKQVCGLELAQKLKELGVKQDGYMSWIKFDETKLDKHHMFHKDDRFVHVYGNVPETIEIASAFTVSELFEIFPKELSRTQVNLKYNHNLYTIKFQGKMGEHSETLPDAIAKMLIYLLKNKLMVI